MDAHYEINVKNAQEAAEYEKTWEKCNKEIEREINAQICFDNPEYCELLRRCEDCEYSEDGHRRKQMICYECMAHDQYKKKEKN